MATSAEGAVGECVPAATASPELKQLILVGPRSSGMGYIALCLGQSLTTGKPSLTLLALAPAQQYWITKSANDLLQCQMG